MNKFKIAFIISFFIILFVPLLCLKRGKDVVSSIDNRMLINNPFSDDFIGSGDKTQDIDDYLSDRIGFRDKMILSYTMLNDICFQEMTHPIYMYGKDGYIFGKAVENKKYSKYDSVFADYVKKVQTYCQERDIAFTFAFDPSKSSVIRDKLPDGYNYDNSWVDSFMNDLRERKVDYVDNLQLMQSLYEDDKKVFNKKYNAGHWNDLGAFYGVNNIISHLDKEENNLSQNDMNDFVLKDVVRDSLLISEFPINEIEIVFSPKIKIEDIGQDIYNELTLNKQYHGFGYYKNSVRLAEGAPRILVFQGSYMNGMGYKFFQNAFGEYIYVHAYQNVTQLDYYMNLFQPDCVVFETAEYTMFNWYYDSSVMEEAYFNPGLLTISEDKQQRKSVSLDDFNVEEGQSITEISMPLEGHENQYVYLKINDQVYDLYRQDNQLFVSVLNDNLSDITSMELILVSR